MLLSLIWLNLSQFISISIFISVVQYSYASFKGTLTGMAIKTSTLTYAKIIIIFMLEHGNISKGHKKII